MTRTDRQRLVVKLGTSTLTGGTTELAPQRVADLVRQVAAVRDFGWEVVLVSSGAMAAGRERLGFPDLPAALPARQMLSAVGQPRLMALYDEQMVAHDGTVAQVLLTRADLQHRRRYLNARDTLHALLGQGVVPVVNENDTVATEEIKVGDNDNLSALVANLVDANLLLLLTDQPGFFTADPKKNPDARRITEVSEREIPAELWDAAGGSGELGTGGMVTKLEAADLARRSGTTCVIAAGDLPDVLLRVVKDEIIGTRFPALVSRLESRKRYILSGKDAGRIAIDDGAARALVAGGSLLPVGVVDVEGTFGRGDTVLVGRRAGAEIARGLVEYASDDLRRIKGHRSDEIATILGYTYGDELIHRDDLVRLDSGAMT